MATTATITPNQGSAPVTLQAGNYSAVDDRRFWGAGVREGVVNGGSYRVIQRAAGANMTVDVASSVGSGAVVQGDSITAQGNYFVPPTTADVNVDIATADATNPRNDLVVLEVKDDQHDAGGLNLARVRVITGTPNGSAAATDAPGANGTPALPSSCLLLAVVRVQAGDTSIVTARINDRRPWSGGVPTYETSLPSPAVDGQEIYYRADSTNGVIWHLRFRNAFNGGNATYPWEFIGGSKLESVDRNTRTTTAATLQDLTGQPSITVPLKGFYEAFTSFYGSHASAGNFIIQAVINNTSNEVEATSSTAAGYYVTPVGQKRIEVTTASHVVKIQNRVSNAGTQGTFIDRYLSLIPVRVG